MKKATKTFNPKRKIFGLIMPTFIFSRDISMGARVLYAFLCNYAAEKDHCWPSKKTLAIQLSCSVSSVKTYIKELVEQELIYLEYGSRYTTFFMIEPEDLNEKQFPKQRMQNEQKLMNDSPSQFSTFKTSSTSTSTCKPKTSPKNECCIESNFKYKPKPKYDYPSQILTTTRSNSDQKGGQILTRGGANSDHINNINKYNNKYTHALKESQTPQAPQKQVDMCVSDFEKVWETYPKKQSKDQAKKEWQKLARSGELPSIEILFSAIRHFSNSTNWQKEEGRFIPFMGKWLRGQNWLAVQDAVLAELKEVEKKQAYEQTYKQRQEQIQQEKNIEKEKNESLRHEFQLFATCFADYKDGNPINSMLSGLWFYLEKISKAPRFFDVPKDNTLTIKDFLTLCKRNQAKKQYIPSLSLNTQNLKTVVF